MKAISISISVIKSTSYFKYLIAMLESIKTNGGILDYKIILFYDYLASPYQYALKKIWKNIEFRKIDVEKYYKYKKSSPGWYCLESFSLREYSRVVSLDLDFICLSDISFLFNNDFGNIGMVKEKTGIYNGGLAVIQDSVLKSSAYEDMLTCDHNKIFLENSNRNKYSKDQKVYNWYFNNKITEIDRSFNYLVSDYHEDANIKMLHYIYKPFYKTGKRQLQAIGADHNMDLIEIFMKYYNKAKETINDKSISQ